MSNYNIVEEYSWTKSPKKIRSELCPTIELIEYDVTLNTVITNLIYKLRGIGGNIEQAYNTLDDLKYATDAAIKDLSENENKGVVSSVKYLGGNFIEKIGSTASKNIDNASIYNGLYVGNETGNSYLFPYLSEFNKQIKNSWSSEYTAGKNFRKTEGTSPGGISGTLEGVGNVMDKISDFADTISSVSNVLEMITHSEKAKTFEPPSSNSYSISFPLFNTFEESDISKNFEFLQNFSRQNLPERRTINLLHPACLYNIFIPGIHYSPASYVSDLTVKNIGTVRKQNIKVNEESLNGILIPDGYLVSITFQDLLTPTRNLFDSITKGKDSRVQVFLSSEEIKKEASDIINSVSSKKYGINYPNKVLGSGNTYTV